MVNIVEKPEDIMAIKTLDQSYFNKATGEVVEFRPQVPFRSITDLKAFNDAEHNDQPTECDQTQYEPLETIIARCQRGEMVFSADKGWFQYSGKIDEDEVLDQYMPEGDLTDIDVQAEKMFEELTSNTPATPVAEPAPAPSPAPVSESAKAERDGLTE